MYYGYIHTYTQTHTYIWIWQKVTWFVTIPTDVSGTNIRTNCTKQKRRINTSYSLKEKDKKRMGGKNKERKKKEE